MQGLVEDAPDTQELLRILRGRGVIDDDGNVIEIPATPSQPVSKEEAVRIMNESGIPEATWAAVCAHLKGMVYPNEEKTAEMGMNCLTGAATIYRDRPQLFSRIS